MYTAYNNQPSELNIHLATSSTVWAILLVHICTVSRQTEILSPQQHLQVPLMQHQVLLRKGGPCASGNADQQALRQPCFEANWEFRVDSVQLTCPETPLPWTNFSTQCLMPGCAQCW